MARAFEFSALEQEIEVKSEFLERLKEMASEESPQEFDEFVLSSIFVESIEGISCFLRLFRIAIRERPLEIQSYCDFLVRVCKKCELLGTFVATDWVTSVFHTFDFAPCEPQILFVVNQLVHHSVIQEDTVAELVCGMYEDYYNQTATRDICTCYFGPEVAKNEYIWNQYVIPTMDHPDAQENMKDASSTWFVNRALMEDDWKQWREMRLVPWGFNKMLDIMMHDDVSQLMDLARDPTFNVDERLKLSALAPFDYLRFHPTYLGVSAFCGAQQCYQFLVTSGADVSLTDDAAHTVAQFAASSDSLEILRDLEQLNAEFDGVFQVSAGFSRYSIFYWKKDSTEMDVTIWTRTNVISQASIENNMYLMKLCIDEGVDVNIVDHNGRFPLYKAIVWNNIEVAKMLLERDTINPQPELIFPACMLYISDEMLEFLLRHPKMHLTTELLIDSLKRAASGGNIEQLKILQGHVGESVFQEWMHQFVERLWITSRWWLFKREFCSFLWSRADATDRLVFAGYAANNRDDVPIIWQWVDQESGCDLMELAEAHLSRFSVLAERAQDAVRQAKSPTD